MALGEATWQCQACGRSYSIGVDLDDDGDLDDDDAERYRLVALRRHRRQGCD